MEFNERLASISRRIEQQAEHITTEEATKTAFIMPFIQQVLGYDVFNPLEVVPEFTADVGVKKGEKVDYAIIHNDEVQILIEAKKIGESLSSQHESQLFRYFSTTTAKIAILTNGQHYKFYTDLESPNKMDEKPFLEVDLLDVEDHAIPELKKLTKKNFDVESIINAAGELKYLSQIKRLLAHQLVEPHEDFIRFCIANVYDGIITQKVREQFTPLILKAGNQFVEDRVNDRLKKALSKSSSYEATTNAEDVADDEEIEKEDDNGIVTTMEEIEGYNIVKAIVRKAVSVERIAARDTKSYFGVLLDDNNRKPICRLRFNRSQKYLGVFDADKNETRIPIESLDEIFNYEKELITAATSYDEVLN